MIQLSVTIQNLLTENLITAFLLLRIYDKDDVTIKCLTTNAFDLPMSDGITYLANGEIMSIDPPSVSTNVDREIFRVRLADPHFIEGVYADGGYIGKFITVRMGFTDRTTQEPILSISDTFIAYSGRIEGTAYALKMETLGESVLELSCSSPMSDLDYKKAIYLSREFVRGRNANDASCDDIYSGSGSLQLKWGRT